MIDQTNPPAIVQSENQSAEFWHEKAMEADKVRSNSSLDHAEALYHLELDDNFKDLGYENFGTYVFKSFGKSKQWAKKLISIHKKFIVELKKTKESLKNATFGKVSKLVSVVDEDNVDELLEFAESATQLEVDEKVKELQGLEPNETRVDDDNITMRFSMPNEVADVIKDSLELAREEYGQATGDHKAADFKALEIMAANYALTREVSGDLEETLDSLFHRMEKAYNIKISWEPNDE
jgi:hypothetical protein